MNTKTGDIGNGSREVADRAREVASDAGRQIIDRANESATKGMSALADKLDQAADSLADKRHGDDIIGQATSKLHSGLRSTAGYLKERDPRTVVEDIDEAIHRHPYRALAVGVAVGWLVGRLMRSSD